MRLWKLIKADLVRKGMFKQPLNFLSVCTSAIFLKQKIFLR